MPVSRALFAALLLGATTTGLGWLLGGPVVAGVPALALLAAVAMGMQWLAFVPAWLGRTERFYDLTGSATYLLLVGCGLWLAASEGTLGVRPLLVAALVAVWAVRLGTFLVRRIHRAGKDGRFDRIKQDAGRFLLAWTLQGVWVFLTVMGALVVITGGRDAPLGPFDALGLGVWALGFGLEVVADRQKSAFNADPAHAGRFVDVGLWAWSRHPNYFGEIVLWTGVALIGSGVFEGSQWLAWISPAFVTLLLTRVSGIPLLEARADAKWGGLADYEAYKARTPVLVPGWPGMRR